MWRRVERLVTGLLPLGASLLIAGCGAVQSTPRDGVRHAAIRNSELATVVHTWIPTKFAPLSHAPRKEFTKKPKIIVQSDMPTGTSIAEIDFIESQNRNMTPAPTYVIVVTLWNSMYI